MAEIFPFRGWRYHSALIQEQPGIIVPPYDVITATEQNSYYDQSPYNYIRAILNRSEGADRYKDAAISLEQWKKNGILIQEGNNHENNQKKYNNEAPASGISTVLDRV